MTRNVETGINRVRQSSASLASPTPLRTFSFRTAPHQTVPNRTEPFQSAPHRSAQQDVFTRFHSSRVSSVHYALECFRRLCDSGAVEIRPVTPNDGTITKTGGGVEPTRRGAVVGPPYLPGNDS